MVDSHPSSHRSADLDEQIPTFKNLAFMPSVSSQVNNLQIAASAVGSPGTTSNMAVEGKSQSCDRTIDCSINDFKEGSRLELPSKLKVNVVPRSIATTMHSNTKK